MSPRQLRIRAALVDKGPPKDHALKPRDDLTGPAWLRDRMVEFESAAMEVQRVASEARWTEYASARKQLGIAKMRLVRAVAANGGER